MTRIIDNWDKYLASLKREIKLVMDENIDAAFFFEKKIDTKSGKYVDLLLTEELSQYKDPYIPAGTGAAIYKNKDDMTAIPAILLQKKGKRKIYAITSLNHFAKLEQFYVRPADYLNILLAQKSVLEMFQEGIGAHLQKINEALKGQREIVPPLEAEVSFIDQNLNESQRKAVKKALGMTEESFLFIIHGPPGTGKTKTITEIVWQLYKQRKNILITSHTNVAVDNVLERLLKHFKENNLPTKELMRVGSRIVVNPKVHEILRPAVEFAKLGFGESMIIGATLSKMSLFVNSKDFNLSEPIFDYVIVDEASMATTPMSLVALLLGRKTILVGDHYQLPPIIRDQSATREIRTSLFEKIITNVPEISVFLDIQYRSNPAIAGFANEAFYGGKLKNHESTLNKKLNLEAKDISSNFEKIIATPDIPIIWFDSFGYSSFEWKKWKRTYSALNKYEAALVLYCVGVFKNAQMNLENDLKIISPFRLQSELISRSVSNYLNIKIDIYETQTPASASTIDRLQGQEYDAVILSLVDDGLSWSISRVLDDFRRINVGITRARKKLIVVGSSQLANSDKSQYLFDLYYWIAKNGKVLGEIPKDQLQREMEAVESAYVEILQNK